MMKTKLHILFIFTVVISLLYIFSCRKAPVKLKLISYNIYHGENPYQKGNSNINSVAMLIQRKSPLFVALQEVDSMTLRTSELNKNRKINLMSELERYTGMTGYFCKAIDFRDGGYGEGILTSESAHFECVVLPVPEGGETRSMAIATVMLKNGIKLSFTGTHLCHEKKENRSAQAKAIVEHFATTDHPIIIAGDFNFEAGEAAYNIMNEYYIDAASEYHRVQNTYPAHDPSVRIDYFWLSRQHKWILDSIYVLDIDFSDHLPLVIDLLIE